MSRLIDDRIVDEAIVMLKAFGEPNRLRIFATLMNGDSCNCELQEELGLAPKLLSHHLRVLENASLVHSRRWIYYSVDRAAAGCWQAWFAHFLDPARIQERPVCGPEGQLIGVDQIAESA